MTTHLSAFQPPHGEQALPGVDPQQPLAHEALARLEAIEGQLWAGLGRLRQARASGGLAGEWSARTEPAVQASLQVIREIRSRSHQLVAGGTASKGK